MIITTTESVPGRQVAEILGIVSGNAAQSASWTKDFTAAFKNIVGNELDEYTQMMSESRSKAYRRMIAQAERLGADAIVGVRFHSGPVSEHASESLAYGTAVKLVNHA